MCVCVCVCVCVRARARVHARMHHSCTRAWQHKGARNACMRSALKHKASRGRGKTPWELFMEDNARRIDLFVELWSRALEEERNASPVRNESQRKRLQWASCV